MTDETLEARLCEINSKIETLPQSQRDHLMQMVEETRQRHHDIKDGIGRANDALDDWRLHMKYLVFDMEASVRESRMLREDESQDSKE